ncbi:cysteine dioxygenase [Polymorphobacter sp.]|uniref:cysteine dioxygenase n=1 Tax=Polymorphobacter sp. TaxID=1909290 RepID=UPI003F6E7410
MDAPPRLERFIAHLGAALPIGDPVALVPALAELVGTDDWLPTAYARPGPQYRQYLLWRDPGARASIVSFVWDRGQGTPIHDHGVWGLVGMLRGAETEQRYRLDVSGCPVPDGGAETLVSGAVSGVTADDLHAVTNASNSVSVSIHVYGTDIGRWPRTVYRPDGTRAGFISGYANESDTPPFASGSS